MSSSVALPIAPQHAFSRRFHESLRAAATIHTLQLNIGRLCNLACRHCHVDSSPARTAPADNMDAETARRIVDWAARQPWIETADITGGSPEMNPSFRFLVEAFRGQGRRVIDRCNPTIIARTMADGAPGLDWIPAFLAAHEVDVIASMPCYVEENVRWQRGRGSFEASIAGLRALNAVGYGRGGPLRLSLVYNPNGATLPPPQVELEATYRRELRDRFGIEFDRLLTIANMPIARWRRELEREGLLEPYLVRLVDGFNPATIDGLMCRTQVNVDPQGRVFDCDFNQAVGLGCAGALAGRFVWECSHEMLALRTISTGDHCYGCTAGAGSGCGGAIVAT